MKKKNQDSNRPTIKEDLDNLEAHLIDAISKTLDQYPPKEDLKGELGPMEKRLEQKINTVEKKVDNLDYKVSDIHRRVIDLETIDPPTRAEFNELKTKTSPQI